MAGATRTIVFAAPIEKCFDVICDYSKYPEFLSEVKSIRIGTRSGNTVDVHYEAEIVKTIKYSVRCTEARPNKLSWTYISGDFMKDNRGGWTLEDLGGGQTKATYDIEVTVGMLVPKTVINMLVDTGLPKLLESFKRRIESR